VIDHNGADVLYFRTMGVWTWSAEIGVLFGVLLFAFLFFPIVAVQYRRYGRFTGARLLGAAAVAVYLTTVVAYTLLPLPASTQETCAPSLQLVPFHFVADIARENAGNGLFGTLTSIATLQVLLNILLFVPLGVIVRGFFSRGLPTTVGVGLGASVLIELTQYTGIWGIYSCSYRLADVDDVITNTLGALIGGVLGPVVLAWMPRERALRAARGTPRPVTVRRRWLGMAIDLALFSALGTVFVVAYRLILLASTGRVPAVPGAFEAALGSLLPALLVFILPATRRTGASLGQTAVWLRPHWPSPASLARRVLRAASVGGLYGVLVFVSRLALPVAATAGLLAGLLLIAALLAVPLTRSRAGLSGVINGASMHDERATAAQSR
jgi:glycopeptide antibiotics resistance protein